MLQMRSVCERCDAALADDGESRSDEELAVGGADLGEPGALTTL